MKRFPLACASLSLMAMMTGAIFAQQTPAPAGNAEHGKTLYRETGCYQCHGLAGQGATMTGPRLSRTAFEFDGFLNQLRHPVNQMPPYEAAILSDQDAADLYAYVRQMPAPRDANSIPQLKAAR
ncbi:MAG TPA: cytochrome c [Bradyrhizobium sp.]|nr:cytochrome c [Bradyrhizobium sp.]